MLRGRGALEVRGQAGLRGGQASHRRARARAWARGEGRGRTATSLRSSTPSRCRLCGAWVPRRWRSCTASASTRSASWRASRSVRLSRRWARANGTHLRRLSMGIDDREVVPHQRAKSIGHEETFARDHDSLDTLQHELVRLADSVAARLRGARMAARTISIKVRFHDFRTITRSTTLPSAVDTGPDVVRAASELLGRIDPSAGVRLLGVHVEPAARMASHASSPSTTWKHRRGTTPPGPSTPSGPASGRTPSCRRPSPDPRGSGSRSGAISSGGRPIATRCRTPGAVER